MTFHERIPGTSFPARTISEDCEAPARTRIRRCASCGRSPWDPTIKPTGGAEPGRWPAFPPSGSSPCHAAARGKRMISSAATPLGHPRELDNLHMDHNIVQSIHQKRRLRFAYNGRIRVVEPQCYGIGRKGTELLRAHQLEGGREPEPLFNVAKMTNLEVLDDSFASPGPHYRKNDSAIEVIFAQL